jgi:mono/diheme cytochrome c family protein
MRSLAIIGALAIIAAIGAAVFFFGGFYNVAATQPDLDPVAWALKSVRTASIDRHATDTPTVSLEDAMVIQAGARAFATRGCVNCHGAPGAAWAKFSEGLRPDPPDLKDIANELTPAQLFFVIKNGINMTGMPAFSLAEVGDPEIWNIVAFVKKLPSVSEADYKSWTETPAAPK